MLIARFPRPGRPGRPQTLQRQLRREGAALDPQLVAAHADKLARAAVRGSSEKGAPLYALVANKPTAPLHRLESGFINPASRRLMRTARRCTGGGYYANPTGIGGSNMKFLAYSVAVACWSAVLPTVATRTHRPIQPPPPCPPAACLHGYRHQPERAWRHRHHHQGL